jgi:hypothetical protein
MMLVTLILGVSLAAGTAHASLLAYDGFNYTGTALDGQDGGTGFSAAWDNYHGGISLSDDGVSLAPSAIPLPVVGSRIISPTTGTARHAFRYVDDHFDFDKEGQMYVSFLMRKNSTTSPTGETIDIMGYTAYDPGPPPVSAVKTFRIILGSTEKFGVSLGGDGIFGYYNDLTAVAGTTYFGVAKVVSHVTAEDEMYLKIYSPGDTVDTGDPAAWDASITQHITGLTLARFRLEYGVNADGDIDEIRYGDTWTDVAGEPAVPGDASGDGQVDEDDAAILAENWQAGPDAGWFMGDFNDDGYVNDIDATLMATNWHHGVNAAVPEPGVLSLMLVLLCSGAVYLVKRA